jgi:hypothetical protein
VPERLAVGTEGQILTVETGRASWISPGVGGVISSSLLVAKGDVIVATAPATAARKAAGSSGGVLTTDVTTADGLRWIVGAALHGRVRLVESSGTGSGTSLTLLPHNGNTLYVKGPGGWSLRSLPSAGLTSANTGAVVDGTGGSNLVANTTYLVTVVDLGDGTLALDFRTTLTRERDPDFGVEIATGQSGCTVVGLVRVGASALFRDLTGERLVLNWFNRRSRTTSNAYTTNRTTNSQTFVEPNIEIRAYFLTWATEAVRLSSGGWVSLTSGTGFTGVGIDGALVGPSIAGSASISPVSVGWAGDVAEGFHYVTLMAATSVSTATGTYPAGTTVYATFQG